MPRPEKPQRPWTLGVWGRFYILQRLAHCDKTTLKKEESANEPLIIGRRASAGVQPQAVRFPWPHQGKEKIQEVQTMNHEIHPVPWEQYSDESAHYSYVRCLSHASHYEVVRVTHDPDGPQAEFVHQIIFMSEYDEPALARILHDFGYASLNAFVHEVNHANMSPADFIRRQDRSIGRDASPGCWIDYMLLASLIAEQLTGRKMDAQKADRLADAITKRPDVTGPYCINRTFLDQLFSIPLTAAEVDAICATKDAQVRTAHLRDEICDLDNDDPCFEGHDPALLVDSAGFIAAVQARWYHYNGHGGDPTENLREAINVTIHEFFPK